MATAYSTLLGLALPVQGELSGTWGDMVDNGITRYVDIAVAGTVTLTNDGAVTLSLTNGDSSATNIVSSLTGAGTVSAQFAIIKVTGTLTTAKVLTPPSSSRTYVVVNAATGSTVTVKASGQTGVSIAVGETAFVYFNGTDYVKVAGTVNTGVTSFQTSLSGLTPSTSTTGAVTLAGTLGTSSGGTNLTSFTSGGVVYASSTSALATGSALQFTGSAILLNTATSNIQLTTTVNTNQAQILLADADGRTAVFRGPNSGSPNCAQIGTSTSHDTAFLYNNSEQMRLTLTGLGIGTSLPAAKLDVTTAYVDPNATAHGTVEFNSNTSFAINKGGSISLGGAYTGTSTTQFGSILGAKENGTDGNYAGYLSFQTRPNGNTSSERMRIDSSGNLCVGSTSAGNAGTINVSVGNPGTTSGGLQLWATTTQTHVIQWGDGTTGSDPYRGYIEYAHNGDSMRFGTAATEKMRLDSAGNLGIGTSSPSTKLHVVNGNSPISIMQSSNGNGGYVEFNNSSTAPLYAGFGQTLVAGITVNDAALRYSNNLVFGLASVEKARITNGFSVGTTADAGGGGIYATGNITAYYSDARLKTVSGKIENALDKVAQLSGVYYTNNSVAKSFGYDSDEVQVGVLAQDVEAVLPQIVKAAPFDLDENNNSKSGENYKTVQYERLVPLLIEAINELRAEVKALKGA